MSTSETIGERLRRLREERGLRQQDIACPGVSAQYISKLERGERTASVKALRKLSPILGVTAQYLET
ncbi:MAG TPA: helix-turn-helix transcriptional regulator, partial [Gaiellaceae bacterium]